MSEPDKKAIGNRIKEELKKRGKTQAWLSDEVGIQKGYLSELINGHPKKRWNTDHLIAIAQALDVPLSVITGTEASPKDKIDIALDKIISGLEAEKKKTLLQLAKALKSDDEDVDKE